MRVGWGAFSPLGSLFSIGTVAVGCGLWAVGHRKYVVAV